MRTKLCPHCGSLPTIKEWEPRHRNLRRYGIYCPNYCLLFTNPYGPFLEVETNGDYNTVVNEWNKEVERITDGK